MPNNRVSAPPSEQDKWFCIGVLSALAQVKHFDNTVLFDQIVTVCGRDVLIAEARRSRNMRWSGMDQYVQRNPEAKR